MPANTGAIEVLQPGPFSTIQDLGRTGYAAMGVSRAGAADIGALRLANRLVGNGAGAAAIEITLGGLTLVLHQALTVALTGARCAGSLDWGVPVSLVAGATIQLAAPAVGLRSYLAVRGGIGGPQVLGSRSTDTLSGLGPPPLRPGDLLAIDDDVDGEVSGVQAVPSIARPRLRVTPGPREDWFTADSLVRLTTSIWTVATDSNRIGVRLAGPILGRVTNAELASEATLRGALQVPPDGQPILLGPDAPVTGGYPVIGVIAAEDLDRTAQLRPGDHVQFSRRAPGSR